MVYNIWRWSLGLLYILAVAAIWIAASYIVQSVVDGGVSPFLITYICNSLFVVYLPIVEIARVLEDSVHKVHQRSSDDHNHTTENSEPELVNLLENKSGSTSCEGIDLRGRWARSRVAKVSILICPFWFFAQLTFNLSLKYTTVTSNTILSSASSLFTFLVSLVFLNEKFTWLKLLSVLLCMAGTVIVSLGDSAMELNAIASNPLFGDVLALVSAFLYAVYITLIRKMLPQEESGEGRASTAEFLGYLGLFNLLIFAPVSLILNLTKLEPFHVLSWKQLSLVVGKGLLDNVLSDYLWAKAVLLTTTTAATAGLTIQVPMAAVVDSLTGHPPRLMDYLGGAAIMAGFAGISIPSTSSSSPPAYPEENSSP
ncbi:eamA-like transporter family [Wolffia australiana]